MSLKKPTDDLVEDLAAIAGEPTALETVLETEPVKFLSAGSLQLYACLVLSYCCSMTQGFDSNTFGGLMAIPQFTEKYGLTTPDAQALATAIYVIGNIPGCFFAAQCSDRFGRRGGMFIGSIFCLAGAAAQAGSTQHSAMLAGRFLLGFGASIVQTAGVAYSSEMANPVFRGFAGGMYSACFSVGTMIATFTEYGLSYMKHTSQIQYRIPLALQGVPSVIVICLVWFLPETPRWLIANNRLTDAKRVLTKYHGNGNPDSLMVALEIEEMQEAISLTGSDKRWWDFRDLFMTKADRYRMFLVLCMAFFSEIDLPPTSYYFPLLCKAVGITDSRTQLLLNALQTPVLFTGALIGVSFIDRFGRRVPLMCGSIGMSASVVVITACTATFERSNVIGGVGVAFLYVFLFVFAMSWTPNQYLYPSELLTFQTRAKGLALLMLTLNLVKLPNTYISPIAIAHSGWKYYILYICTDALAAVVIYFFFVETKGHTLEEMETIFHSPNPVKTSMERSN